MTTFPHGPATDNTASKLLPPRRRRQIEIWLDETVHYESLQNCAADKRHGHASDLPAAADGPIPTPSLPTPAGTHCPVCFRYLKGREPRAAAPDCPAPPAAPDPKAADGPRSVFRGLRAAVAFLKPRDAGDKPHDPALSTRMFLVPHDGDGRGSIEGSTSSAARLGSSDDGDAGKRLLDERMARLRRAQKLLEKGQVK